MRHSIRVYVCDVCLYFQREKTLDRVNWVRGEREEIAQRHILWRMNCSSLRKKKQMSLAIGVQLTYTRALMSRARAEMSFLLSRIQLRVIANVIASENDGVHLPASIDLWQRRRCTFVFTCHFVIAVAVTVVAAAGVAALIGRHNMHVWSFSWPQVNFSPHRRLVPLTLLVRQGKAFYRCSCYCYYYHWVILSTGQELTGWHSHWREMSDVNFSNLGMREMKGMNYCYFFLCQQVNLRCFGYWVTCCR